MNSLLESVGVQRVINLNPILEDVFLPEKNIWDRVGSVVRSSDLVPVRECDILAAGDPLKGFLEAEQVCPVPSREKHVAMVAVATPPTGVAITSPAERFSMEASNGEERIGIGIILLWRVSLDADPSLDEEVLLRIVALHSCLSLPLLPCRRPVYLHTWAISFSFPSLNCNIFDTFKARSQKTSDFVLKRLQYISGSRKFHLLPFPPPPLLDKTPIR